jgi:hypothetical protein
VAERERRAKVISAEGEYQASRRLGQAADVMARHPAALQLRYLQTLVEVAAENNSTTLFPIPIDIFRGITEKFLGGAAGGSAEALPPEPREEEEALVERSLGEGGHPPALGRGLDEDAHRATRAPEALDRAQRGVSLPAGDKPESGSAKR